MYPVRLYSSPRKKELAENCHPFAVEIKDFTKPVDIPAGEIKGREREAAAEHELSARDPRGVEAREVEGLRRVQAPEEVA